LLKNGLTLILAAWVPAPLDNEEGSWQGSLHGLLEH
jgi:hypothetical protein